MYSNVCRVCLTMHVYQCVFQVAKAMSNLRKAVLVAENATPMEAGQMLGSAIAEVGYTTPALQPHHIICATTYPSCDHYSIAHLELPTPAMLFGYAPQ